MLRTGARDDMLSPVLISHGPVEILDRRSRAAFASIFVGNQRGTADQCRSRSADQNRRTLARAERTAADTGAACRYASIATTITAAASDGPVLPNTATTTASTLTTVTTQPARGPPGGTWAGPRSAPRPSRCRAPRCSSVVMHTTMTTDSTARHQHHGCGPAA